jgi:hypothetical protein
VSEGTRHQYGLLISAFLGGISFTIMAFLIKMHTDNKFHYPMIDNIPLCGKKNEDESNRKSGNQDW